MNSISIYNPKSVVESILRGQFNNYWTSTETYEALKVYIEMNFDGLKDKVTQLISGEKIEINPIKVEAESVNEDLSKEPEMNMTM